MKRPVFIASAAIGLLLLVYAGCYLRLRLQVALVHRAMLGEHVIVANEDRAPRGSAIPGDEADAAAIRERERRSTERMLVLFLPVRWLECRCWDLVDLVRRVSGSALPPRP